MEEYDIKQVQRGHLQAIWPSKSYAERLELSSLTTLKEIWVHLCADLYIKENIR